MIALLLQLVHVALMLVAAPLALGLSRRAAARLAGRRGPSLLQPLRDLRRLAAKQAVFAESASRPFEAAPALVFAASLLAAALVPSFALGMAAAPLADLIVVIGLLLLARAILALAAIEAGTAAGGIGASRAMALSAFTEPAALLAIVPLALLVGTTNLDVMAGVLREGTVGIRLPLVLAVAALLVVAVARLGEPQAELVEEFSGRHLALLLWAGALRRLVWLGLLADLIFPQGLAEASAGPLAWLVGLVAWVVKIGVLSLLLAPLQGARAARPGRLAETLGLAVLLALLAAASLFAGQGIS